MLLKYLPERIFKILSVCSLPSGFSSCMEGNQGPPLCLVVVKKIRSKSLSVLSFFEDLQHCWDSLAQGLPALSGAGIGSGIIPQ